MHNHVQPSVGTCSYNVEQPGRGASNLPVKSLIKGAEAHSRRPGDSQSEGSFRYPSCKKYLEDDTDVLGNKLPKKNGEQSQGQLHLFHSEVQASSI